MPVAFPMLNRCQAVVLIALVLSAAVPLHAQTAVDVAIRIDSPESRSAFIDMRLSDLPAGTGAVTMFMGREFAFTRTVDPAVLHIVAGNETDDNLVIARNSVNTWRIETGGASSIRIEYEVGLTQREHPDVVANRDQYEWPYLDEDHGLLYTAAMLMLPRDLDLHLNQLRIRIDPPAGWDTIAPWPRDADGTYRPPDLGSFLNDYIAIGAWQQNVIAMGDFTATIAVAPGQEQIVRAAIQPIRRIVEYELELFEWQEPGKFLFCFGRPDDDGTAGSPKSNSMTLMVAPDEDPQRALESISHLIAHEFFHLWASAHVGRMPDELRFFNEGFTEYYAWLVSARLGLISWERFAEALGESMLRCDRLKPTSMSMLQAGGPEFFLKREANTLVYHGGLLNAALLDAKIRAAQPGRSLDDFMRSFLNDAKWTTDRDGGEPRAPTLPDFRAAMERFVDDAAWIEGYIGQLSAAWALVPERAFAAVGVEVLQTELPLPIEFGGSLDGSRLVNVTTGLGASQLGLQAGDVILELNGQAIDDGESLAAAWESSTDGGITLRYLRGDDVYRVTAQLPRGKKFDVLNLPWRD